MANIPRYDPRDSEVLSPLMAGFSEALVKLSSVLNLNTKTITNVELEKLPWTNSQGKTVMGVLYQAPDNNKLWVTSPAPVIRKNGAVINPATNYFTIDPIGGGIFFQEEYSLLESDTVTVDATIVVPESKALYDIINDISELKTKASHDKGYYATVEELKEQHATAVVGDFALIGSTDTLWVWDDGTSQWVDSHKATDLSNYYTKPQTDNLLEQKEPNINPKGDSAADDNFYYGGRKQWIDLLYKIRNTVLSGLDTSAKEIITATDTVIGALGKLQAQVTDTNSTVSTHTEKINALTQADIEIKNSIKEVEKKNTEQDQSITNIQSKDTEQDGKITGLEQGKADKTELPNKVFTATLSVEGWNLLSEGIYSQSITNSSVTATDKLNIAPTTDGFIKEMIDAGIVGLVAKNDNGTLSVLAYGEKPKQEITVSVEIVSTTQI